MSSSITLETLQYNTQPQATSYENGRLKITAPGEVDWWRNPEPVKVNRKDGTFKYTVIDGSRPFRCQVWLRSALVGEYDQSCLVVHGGSLNDDWAHWLKCGVETFYGRQWINAVVATPFCDVSTTVSQKELSLRNDGDWIYLNLTKELTITGHTISIRWASRSDPNTGEPPTDEEMTSLREIQAFAVNDRGERSEDYDWAIGVMVSGLCNPSGAQGEFQGFHFAYLD